MGIIFLIGAIAFEVTGTMAMRAATDGSRWWWALVAAGYLGAFGLLAVVLRTGMPVGVAYAIWAACGVVLTALLGRLIFADPLTWRMGLGIILIAAGVALIETGSRAHS